MMASRSGKQALRNWAQTGLRLKFKMKTYGYTIAGASSKVPRHRGPTADKDTLLKHHMQLFPVESLAGYIGGKIVMDVVENMR